MLRIVVFAHEQQIVQGRCLEERRIQLSQREKGRDVGFGVALHGTLEKLGLASCCFEDRFCLARGFGDIGSGEAARRR